MAVVDDERWVDLGSRQFANNLRSILQLPEGAGIRRLLPTQRRKLINLLHLHIEEDSHIQDLHVEEDSRRPLLRKLINLHF